VASKFPDEIRALEQNLERQVKEEKKSVLQHEGLSGLCSLSVRPEFVPLKQMSYPRLAEIIGAQLSARPDFSGFLSRVPEPQRANLGGIEQLAKFSVDRDESLDFSNGILRIKNLNRETLISEISLNSQRVAARVSGTTTEAFHVCKLVLVALWASSDAEAEWEELALGVKRASYQTSTISRLPINMKNFFNPALTDFLDSPDAKKFASQMGLRDLDPEAAQFSPNDFAVSTTMREVDIRLARFNVKTGFHEQSVLNIIPDSVWDSNVGALKISSELPYEDHVEYVNLLAKSLKPV
jgi:hypothetical protein